jgi:hypothetical protein
LEEFWGLRSLIISPVLLGSGEHLLADTDAPNT